MSYPDYLNPIERQIIDVVVKGALAAGMTIAVYGEGELDLKPSSDYEAITREIAATGITDLGLSPGNHWIQFVHGNGCDVLSDYTVKSEDLPFIAEASALAERLAA